MSKPRTRIAIVLDKSGSMASTKRQAIEGLNEQIQQAKIRAGEHDLRCSLVTFNGEVFEHLWDVPADKLMEAKVEDYIPIGGTAMRDAVGYTVQKLLNTEQPDDKDTAYLVYVISDGDTNSDMHYSQAALKELTESCQATGRWTFTYMGHDPKYMEKLSRDTGVPLSNMAVWSNRDSVRTRGAFQHQNKRMNKFLDERATGKLQACDYASDSVGCLADFTSDEDGKVADTGAPAAVPTQQPVYTPLKLEDLLGKLPKYENVAVQHVSYSGESLFANTVGVKWTHEATSDLESQHGMSVNACSMGAPEPVKWSNTSRRP